MLIPRQTIAASSTALPTSTWIDVTSSLNSASVTSTTLPITSATSTLSASIVSTAISSSVKSTKTAISSKTLSTITTSSIASTSALPSTSPVTSISSLTTTEFSIPALPSPIPTHTRVIEQSQSTVQEFFGTIFQGPLNIALTSLVIAALVALLAVIIAFCVRRSKQNKRKSAARMAADGEDEEKKSHQDDEKDSAEDELSEDESAMVSLHPQAIYARRFEQRIADGPRAPFVARPLVMPEWTSFAPHQQEGQQQHERKEWNNSNGPNRLTNDQLPRGMMRPHQSQRPHSYQPYQSHSQRPLPQQRLTIDQPTGWTRPESQRSGSLPILVTPSHTRSASMTSISAVIGSPMAPLSRKEAWSPSYDHIVPDLSQFVPQQTTPPTPATLTSPARRISPIEMFQQPSIDRILDPRSIPMEFTPLTQRPSRFASLVASLPPAYASTLVSQQQVHSMFMSPQTKSVSNMVNNRWEMGARLAVGNGNGNMESPEMGSMDSHSCYEESDAGHPITPLPVIRQSLRSQLPSSSTSAACTSSPSSSSTSSTTLPPPRPSPSTTPKKSGNKPIITKKNSLRSRITHSNTSLGLGGLGPTSLLYSSAALIRQISSRKNSIKRSGSGGRGGIEKRESGIDRLRRARTIVAEERASRLGL